VHRLRKRNAAKEKEKQLWNAVDPDGKSAVNMPPVQTAAQKLYGNTSKAAEAGTSPGGSSRATYRVGTKLATGALARPLTVQNCCAGGTPGQRRERFTSVMHKLRADFRRSSHSRNTGSSARVAQLLALLT
jgi:hypothetical protein